LILILGAPLNEGLVEGQILRCPWHHACFDLQSGAALSAPAFDSLSAYEVEVLDGRFTGGAQITQSALASSVRHCVRSYGDHGRPKSAWRYLRRFLFPPLVQFV